MSSPNSYLEALTPSVMVLGGWAFGHEGKAPIIGLVSLLGDHGELLFTFLHVRTQEKMFSKNQESKSSPDTEFARVLISVLQPP